MRLVASESTHGLVLRNVVGVSGHTSHHLLEDFGAGPSGAV